MRFPARLSDWLREAGDLLAEHFGRLSEKEHWLKGKHDVVSVWDRQVEELLRTRLQKATPDIPFVGEETGGQLPARGPAWILDPLDGTRNFIHGFPYFCISLCLVDSGAPQAAWIYAPLERALFFARRGEGAFCNDRPLRVRQPRALEGALVASGFPQKFAHLLPRYWRVFAFCVEHAVGVRRTGSAALDLAHIAAGHLDATFQYGLSPWDFLAGALLVEEAGGEVRLQQEAGHWHIFAGAPRLVQTLWEVDHGAAA